MDSPYSFLDLCQVVCWGRGLYTRHGFRSQHFICTLDKVVPIWGKRPNINIGSAMGTNMNPTNFLSFPWIKDIIQQLHILKFWVWQKEFTNPGYMWIAPRWNDLASTQIWHPPLLPYINGSSIPNSPYSPFQNDISGLKDTMPSMWAPWWNDRIKNTPTWKFFCLKHFVN